MGTVYGMDYDGGGDLICSARSPLNEVLTFACLPSSALLFPHRLLPFHSYFTVSTFFFGIFSKLVWPKICQFSDIRRTRVPSGQMGWGERVGYFQLANLKLNSGQQRQEEEEEKGQSSRWAELVSSSSFWSHTAFSVFGDVLLNRFTFVPNGNVWAIGRWTPALLCSVHTHTHTHCRSARICNVKFQREPISFTHILTRCEFSVFRLFLFFIFVFYFHSPNTESRWKESRLPKRKNVCFCVCVSVC